MIKLRIVLIVMALYVVARLAFGYFYCSQKWGLSGRDIKYNPVSGCLVQNWDNKYVPESVMREQ